MAEIRQRYRAAMFRIHGFPERSDRVGQHPLPLVSFPKKDENAGEAGGLLEEPRALADDVIVPARRKEMPYHMRPAQGVERVDFQSGLAVSERSFKLPHGDEIVRQPVVGAGITGIQFDSPIELALCAGPVPAMEKIGVSEGGVSFPEIRIDLERSHRGAGSLGEEFFLVGNALEIDPNLGE